MSSLDHNNRRYLKQCQLLQSVPVYQKSSPLMSTKMKEVKLHSVVSTGQEEAQPCHKPRRKSSQCSRCQSSLPPPSKMTTTAVDDLFIKSQSTSEGCLLVSTLMCQSRSSPHFSKTNGGERGVTQHISQPVLCTNVRNPVSCYCSTIGWPYQPLFILSLS